MGRKFSEGIRKPATETDYWLETVKLRKKWDEVKLWIM